ncbi:MAG: glutathionylspermidine synthase family protein [Pseudomonadota bacterium]
MQRLTTVERGDWKERAAALGFKFHTIDGAPYWTESAAYLFTAAEVDEIEAATAELERMCLEAVDRVVRDGLYERFGMDRAAAELVEASWRRFDKNLYGRFDLAYRPGQPPKLLEYNADTPTALFEASVVQWEWLQSLYPTADQFNSIHEKLIEAWQRFDLPSREVHFACVRDHDEDRGTVDYLRDTALQAGLETPFLLIDEIGWDGQRFVDLDQRPIRVLFKLYPWEWLMREAFAPHIGPSGVHMIEPAWKMVLSNKAVLALLWEMFEGHPNLLAAAHDPAHIDGPMVEKPILGREGGNVRLFADGRAGPPTLATEGAYGAEGMIYQALAPLPEFEGNHPVIGAWTIASQPAGMGVREDATPVTRNTSRFVPHLFR